MLIKSTDAGQLQMSDIRSDQYGMRTRVFVEGKPIKFEIVLEGRIGLAKPGKKDSILGVASLTKLDMAASKLLANSDRGLDMGMHCRDVIDLAKVIGMLGEANGLLERCMKAMDVSVPRALLWQNISKLKIFLNDVIS